MIYYIYNTLYIYNIYNKNLNFYHDRLFYSSTFYIHTHTPTYTSTSPLFEIFHYFISLMNGRVVPLASAAAVNLDPSSDSDDDETDVLSASDLSATQPPGAEQNHADAARVYTLSAAEVWIDHCDGGGQRITSSCSIAGRVAVPLLQQRVLVGVHAVETRDICPRPPDAPSVPVLCSRLCRADGARAAHAGRALGRVIIIINSIFSCFHFFIVFLLLLFLLLLILLLVFLLLLML